MGFDVYNDGYASDGFFKHLKESLPAIFTREVAAQKTGGIFTARTLSNLDSAGKGPSVKRTLGSKVVYEKENFIEWLEGKLRPQRKVSHVTKHSFNNSSYFGMIG